jgi:membrane protease YdiL (CAAX protease family)
METSEASGQLTPASGGLRQVIRQHPLFFFFLIAYAFSWLLLLPSVLSAWNILQGDFTVTFVIHTFGPALAAIIITGIVEGRTGLLSLQQRIRQWRAGWRWYLFILMGIPALIMLGIIIQPGAFASFQGLTPLLLVKYPLAFIVVWFGGGPLGEEIGWRGFALPRMQPRYGPLRGTLLLDVLWCFWHLLEFLMPTQGGGPGTGLATFLTNFSMFFGMVLALTIILTWVFNNTRGSIFISITAHAGVNTPQVILLPLFLAADYTGLLLAGLIGLGLPALLIVILTRGRLGYQPI